jgi:hypothetical protein
VPCWRRLGWVRYLCALGSCMVHRGSPGIPTTSTLQIRLFSPPSKQIQRLCPMLTCGRWTLTNLTLRSTTYATLSSNTSTLTSWYVPARCLSPHGWSHVSCEPQGMLANRHITIADQSKVRRDFVYVLIAFSNPKGWCFRRTVHKARRPMQQSRRLREERRAR